MALVVADRVKETTTTTGTGTVTLAGAVTGFQSFAVVGNANTTYYAIVVEGGSDWEVGIGTYTSSGTTLSRDTVLESSNSNSLVNFGVGTKAVFVTYPADRSVTSDYPNTFTNDQVISVNSSTNALRITQTGSGNALLVEDSANPDSSPFIITNAGVVGIGTTTPQAGTTLAVTGISVFGRNGTNGYTQLNEGTAANTGYLSFWTAADVRQAYIGFIGSPNDALNIETDSGSNKPVRIATNALTRVTVAATGSTTFDGQVLLNQDYVEKRFTANSSTAITLDLANGTMQDITLTASTTITMPTAVAGKSFILFLRSGAGTYTVAWTTVKWPGGTAPTVTATASRLDIYSFFSDGTNWYGITVSQNYTP
jgi:hypothetical protein